MADIQIRLGAEDWRLRPSFGAMREIEAATSSSCATLLQLLARRELHIAEHAWIVYHGALEAGHKPTDPEAIGKRLWEKGVDLPAVRDPVAHYLIELLYAPDEQRKKAAGEWWRETEDATSTLFFASPTGSDGARPTSGPPLPGNSGPASPPSASATT